MKVIEARNVCQALPKGLNLLTRYGVKQQSRGGAVLVMPCPVVTVTERPAERVLTSAQRNANPYFGMYEAVWMLAGRNDSAPLNSFIKGFGSRYGEEDGTIHGAYGHRWRDAFGVDQLNFVVEKMRADNTTRQCVIQMWDCSPLHTDLTGQWNDRPCLAGDTILWSPEGDMPIAEVAAKFERGEITKWPVYAARGQSSRIAWATNVWCSGRRRTMKITFNDGSEIRCTKDHGFYRYDNLISGNISLVEAGSLRVGDHIQARRRFYEKGYERFGGMVAHQYAEMLMGPRPQNHIVHHINEVKTDNRANNLSYISKIEHDRHHHLGDANPMRQMDKARREQKGKVHSAWMKQHYANHVITRIEEGLMEKVYDFTVPDWHTAVIGTGIVTHNCNDLIFLQIHGRRLDLTVCCRSNDAVWGCHGANAVHFSILHEYLAARIGAKLGIMYQWSNNYHVYLSELNRLVDRKVDDDLTDDRYVTGKVKPLAMFDAPDKIDDDIERFMDLYEGRTFPQGVYANYWFEGVMGMAMASHHHFKIGQMDQAMWYAGQIAATDWRVACCEWLERITKQRAQKNDNTQGAGL